MNSTCELERRAARALKPYPAYKDSGVEWLGQVPAHWRVAPVKQHYAIRLGKMLQPARRASDDCRISYLKAKHVQWFEVRTNDIDTMWATPDEVDRYGIVVGDLLVCEGGEGGRCGIVKHGTALPDPCIIQNALHRVRPRNWGSVGDISRNDYLQYMMSTVASAGWFDVLTDKATIAHLTAEKFGALLAPIPPLPEQAAIVRFLDHADRRIRRYIRAQQKLVMLLEEQKQAIIHQAVTGQIDVRSGRPYPAYKPSGVEWLGDVPEHWQVKRSKRVFMPRRELARANDIQLSATQAYGVISQQRYEEVVGRKVVRILRHLEQRRHVEVDDFVISMRSFQGGLERAWESGCIRSSYIVLRPATKLIVGYFGYLFKSVGYINALQATANFIRDGQDLNFENYCRVDLPFPSIEEQQGIAQFLDQTTTATRSTVERYRGQIGLLREYRTRLIADVVTGKLDVRAAAARLPDEVEELEPLDEADALIDGEEEPTDALATAP